MAKPSSQNHLKENHRGIDNRHRVHRRRPGIIDLLLFGHPPPAGEHRNAQNRCKDNLPKARMNHRQPVMQKLQHHLTADNRLNQHARHRDAREPAKPPALFLGPDQNRQNQRAHGHHARNHAMRMLVENSATHVWKEFVERQRPVRHRQRRALRGHQRPENEQKNRPQHQENGELMDAGMVSGLHSRNSSRRLYPNRKYHAAEMPRRTCPPNRLSVAKNSQISTPANPSFEDAECMLVSGGDPQGFCNCSF